MMSRSQMLASVSQAVFLQLVDTITGHHLVHNMFSEAEPFFAHLATPVNGTNSTMPDESDFQAGEVEWGKFFKSQFPRDAATIVVGTIFLYHWYLWLERILPTRSRTFATAPPSTSASEKTEGDEEVEEEIIKKWIAQGKIKRSSVNWTNTFLKWILHLTLGMALWRSTWVLTSALVRLKKPQWIVEEFKELHWRVLGSWISTMPLSSLAGFIIIPAYKRIVFDSAIELAATVFIGAFMSKVIPWVLRQDFMQEAMRQHNETMANGTNPHLQIGGEL